MRSHHSTHLPRPAPSKSLPLDKPSKVFHGVFLLPTLLPTPVRLFLSLFGVPAQLRCRWLGQLVGSLSLRQRMAITSVTTNGLGELLLLFNGSFLWVALIDTLGLFKLTMLDTTLDLDLSRPRISLVAHPSWPQRRCPEIHSPPREQKSWKSRANLGNDGANRQN